MFKLIKQSKQTGARLGRLKTKHGVIDTPFFMPVATQGAVKHVATSEMKSLGASILLANTYHLMLRPGSALIKKAGGLHQFMNWDGPILTDSGGFQIFSLASPKSRLLSGTKAALVSGPPSFKTTARQSKSLVKLTKKGVDFSSYVDGSRHHLSPEDSLKIQVDLGVDIAVCLDECVALPASKKYIAESVELTSLWARRSKTYWQTIKGDKPLLFAVVQGGLDKSLRLKSLADLRANDFDGYNIGGLSVGETACEMYKVLDYLTPAMPENKPRYLMGVGYPENILEAVKRGVDMFDCVIPTREGRHGRLFLFKDKADKQVALAMAGKKYSPFYEQININNAKFAKDFKIINKNSANSELTKLSRAYLHYLFKINEPLGQRLASLNNLEFYLELMKKISKNIK